MVGRYNENLKYKCYDTKYFRNIGKRTEIHIIGKCGVINITKLQGKTYV